MRRQLKSGLSSALACFGANERGTIAIIFALSAIPLAGITALAIDYGRASRVQSTLQRAGDAAAEALLPHLLDSRDRQMQVARTQLDANLPPQLQKLPFTLEIPSDKSTISLSVATDVPTSLAGVMGVPSIPARSETTFRVPQKPILPEAPGVAIEGVGRGQPGTARKPTDAELRELQRQVEMLERQLAEAMKSGGLPPDVERMLRELSRR